MQARGEETSHDTSQGHEAYPEIVLLVTPEGVRRLHKHLALVSEHQDTGEEPAEGPGQRRGQDSRPWSHVQSHARSIDTPRRRLNDPFGTSASLVVGAQQLDLKPSPEVVVGLEVDEEVGDPGVP